jgi:predicted Zn-dependent protease
MIFVTNLSEKIMKFNTLTVRKNLFLLFILGILTLTTSCSDDGGVNLYTVQDDKKLGEQLDEQIKSNPDEYRLYYQNPASNYVQDIVNSIIQSSLIKYRTIFEYKTQIIYNDSVVNAFCTPGGFVYVYTGLMKFLDNEATLAGVLAHEVAHAERRHATKRMTKAYGISVLLGIALGSNPGALEQMGANMFSGLYLMYNSREDEYEADEYSFKYLQSTKWYPGAIQFFFDKIKQNENANFLELLMRSHPFSQDRWDKIEDMLKSNNIPAPTEGNLFTTDYQNIIKTLP